MDLSVALSSLEKGFLYEVVENHILQYIEAVQSAQMSNARSLQLDTIWSSWDRTQECLRGLGYRWQEGDCWYKLGFSLHEGPSPNLSSVEQRWELASAILSGAEDRPNLFDKLQNIERVSASLQGATLECAAFFNSLADRELANTTLTFPEGT